MLSYGSGPDIMSPCSRVCSRVIVGSVEKRVRVRGIYELTIKKIYGNHCYVRQKGIIRMCPNLPNLLTSYKKSWIMGDSR